MKNFQTSNISSILKTFVVFLVFIAITPLIDSQESSGEFDYTKNIDAKVLTLNIASTGEIPAGLFKLNKLEELTIAGEEVTVLPVDVKVMLSLKVLNLSNTPLEALPEELSQLRGLQEIHLNYERWQYRLDEVKRITRAKIILD